MQKFRLGFLAAILLCSQLHCATLGAVFIVGSPVNGTKASIGTGIGFAGDMAIAVKIGSLGGVVYGLTSALTLLFILGISVIDSDLDREMEYAAYPKSSQGRLLQKFIGTARTTLLVLEPPSHSSYGNEKLEKQIYASFDEFGYFRLISSEKRVDLILTGSWNEIRNRGKVIGKETGSELILHVKVLPYSSGCGVEPINDYMCIAGAIASQQVKPCLKKPTAYRYSKAPLEAKLLNVDTGESILTSSKDVLAKVFSSPGDLECPPNTPELWKSAIRESAQRILPEISPRMKTIYLPRPITKDPDPDVAEKLENGLEELSGDTPSFRKAMAEWQKADRIAGGKSDGALINMSLYFFQAGEREKAINLLLQAEKLEGPNVKFARTLRDRFEQER